VINLYDVEAMRTLVYNILVENYVLRQKVAELQSRVDELQPLENSIIDKILAECK